MTEVYEGVTNMFNEGNVSGNGSTNIWEFDPVIDNVITVLSIVILIVTMISIGCTMEFSKIKTHVLKPKGVAIALLAQFGIMPLTAFCLAKFLQLDDIETVTVLICGCCPGGTLSNIFSLVLKGDMNLSIVMTTCSSVAALGLMPGLLYIYCQSFPGLEKAVPYTSIIITLVLSLVPCAIGISINHYKPQHALYVKKAGLIILVMVSIAMPPLCAINIGKSIWMIFTADILTVAILMPLIGFTLGYVMSVICKLNAKCSRTVSMETGCQNIQLCGAILKVAFPWEVIGYMYLFPLIYITFQCGEALLLALCFRCYRKFKPPAEDARIQDNADVKQQQP